MKIKPLSEIQDFCKKFADELNMRIVEVEFKQGKNPELNFYIEKEGGMDLDGCELFHKAIFEPLDELDPTFGMPYTLNVSSPGADRAFKTDEDFLSRIGKMVEVKVKESIKGKKAFDGILLSYDKKIVTVKVDQKTTLTIDMKNLSKMNDYIEFK